MPLPTARQACPFLAPVKGKCNMKKVEDLDVFKLSHSLALRVFELTKKFSRRRSIWINNANEENIILLFQ